MRYLKQAKKISRTQHVLHTSSGKVDFTLKRSSARRTLCISIDNRADVVVAAPIHSAHQKIEQFIEEKSKWIIEKIKEAQKSKSILEQKSFTHGQQFLFLGKKCRLNIIKDDIVRSRISFNGEEWRVTVSDQINQSEQESAVKKKMIQWYRVQAQEILGGRIFHYSRTMGCVPKKIAIRTQKRMWGCCDYHAQTIHLNWQIILSPAEVVDYVVVHEMCHLFVPNHSKRFWKRVEKYMPDYDQYRKWLKINSLDMILP